MGEVDETPVSKPVDEQADTIATEPDVAETLGASVPEVTETPAGDAADEMTPVPASADQEADLPGGDETGAELIARLAAELSDDAADEGADGAAAGDVGGEAAEAPLADADANDATDASAGEPSSEPASGADDLESAIAAANEQMGVEPQPAPTDAASEDADLNLAVRFGAPWWPFLLYFVAWMAFAAYGVWQLKQLPAGEIAYESQAYALFLLGGLIMAAVGPILVLAVWVGSRFGSSRHKTGLFSSAFLKGAIVTLFGVALWWGTFLAVDYLRLGRTF